VQFFISTNDSRAEAQRRGGKDKGFGSEKTIIVAPLKSENHLIDQQRVMTTFSKGVVSKETLPLVTKSLRLCASARESLVEIKNCAEGRVMDAAPAQWLSP